MKDAVFGTVRTHLRQKAQLERNPLPDAAWQGRMAAEDLSEQARKAMDFACVFHQYLDPGPCKASALKSRLEQWWNTQGCVLVTKTSGNDGDWDDVVSSGSDSEEDGSGHDKKG